MRSTKSWKRILDEVSPEILTPKLHTPNPRFRCGSTSERCFQFVCRVESEDLLLRGQNSSLCTKTLSSYSRQSFWRHPHTTRNDEPSIPHCSKAATQEARALQREEKTTCVNLHCRFNRAQEAHGNCLKFASHKSSLKAASRERKI